MNRPIHSAQPRSWDRKAIESPLTPEELQRIRERAYRAKGWRILDYRYPNGTRLQVIRNGIRMRPPRNDISFLHARYVQELIKEARERIPTADIYITIPSKANTQ